MPKTTIDERELWKFAERTAEQVESWPSWKKEGWAVLDDRNSARSINKSGKEDYRLDGRFKESEKKFE